MIQTSQPGQAGQPNDEMPESTPAQTAAERWEATSRGARFGGYLGAWVGAYVLFDLLMLAIGSGGGFSLGAFFALAALLTVPGQLIVGPTVCAALALGRARIRPLQLVLPFIVAGLPVCFVVSRIAYSLYWSLGG